MIRNYLKLALRNMGRRKLYTAINLIGLGVASAFCILVYWYVQHERSFDRFHHNIDRLYRVETSDVFSPPSTPEKQTSEPEQENMIVTPVILAGALKQTFPEIEHAVRIQETGGLVVSVNNQVFKEKDNAAYVDADFFEVFSFPLLTGNPATVLAAHNSVVLSEKTVTKYFGKENPIGKTILLVSEDSALFTVTGVAKNFPANSSFQFDLVLPRESKAGYNEELARGLNTFSDYLILELRENTRLNAFEQKLDEFSKQYFGSWLQALAADAPDHSIHPEKFHLMLRPFAEAHYNKSNGWPHYTNLKNIYQLGALAAVILLIACLNYILLTLTGTVSRSQEVGIRKTVGAGRKQVLLQFFIETQVLSFFAVAIGFVVAVLTRPFFSSLIGSDLTAAHFSGTKVVLFLLLLAMILGLLAGLYPGLVMSGLKSLNLMRKLTPFRLNPVVARLLIATQFAVCTILIIASLVITRQMRYINEKDLGFDKEQVLTIENPYGFGDMEKLVALKGRLQQYAVSQPFIQDFTSTQNPYGAYDYNTHIVNGERVPLISVKVDFNYFSFFKIPIVKGRGFSPEIPSDSAMLQLTESQYMAGATAARHAVVVNETLYKMLGQPPLGVINRAMGGPIVGVCKDYHTEDLTKKIAPAYFTIAKYPLTFWIRLKARQSIPQALNKIETAWKTLAEGQPFSYTFLDEDVAKNYDAYLRWMHTVTGACVLAIVIACMGLFGLSGLIAVSRTNEIGIRKVLGASVGDLFLLLNKNTLLMALFSFVVAVPIAWYLVNAWLQNFAYRVAIGWSLFLLAGVLSLLTALIAVSYHTLKTARTNPVNSLRTE